MLRGSFGDQAALHRFEREARASARLHHPNIVSVLDVGRVSDRGAYLVMEYVRGDTMRSRDHGSCRPRSWPTGSIRFATRSARRTATPSSTGT